jgi:hypothetical protein
MSVHFLTVSFKYKIQCYWNKVRGTKAFPWAPVIFNTVNFFCFNSNVSNLYTKDVIIYQIKKIVGTVLFVNEVTYISYYNTNQSLKKFIKRNDRDNIGLNQRLSGL